MAADTDRAHIETRLLVVTQMLDSAVEELSRVVAALRGEVKDPATSPAPGPCDDADKSEETPNHG